MHRVLDQLDSPESLLLMYLSEELSAGDRARVEQMLAGDADLRARLEQLRQAQDAVETAMRRLDCAIPLPGSEAPALRKMGREIRQWQADRAANAARPHTLRRTLRFPWWSYPLAAAAAITFAFFTWWYNFPELKQMAANPDPTGSTTMSAPYSPTTGSTVIDPVHLASSLSLESLEDPRGDLSDLENNLLALQTLRESLQ